MFNVENVIIAREANAPESIIKPSTSVDSQCSRYATGQCLVLTG